MAPNLRIRADQPEDVGCASARSSESGQLGKGNASQATTDVACCRTHTAFYPNFPTFGPESPESSHFTLFSETLLQFLLLPLPLCML